jgi:hypothetical protein
VAVATTNPVFFCPTRRAPTTVTYIDQYTPPLTGGMITHALCDYAASNFEGTGVVRQYTPTRFNDILDGISKTLLVGEKRLNQAYFGSPEPDDNEGYTCGFEENTIRYTNRSPLPDLYVANGSNGDKRFGSAHFYRWHAVFADGSVRPLSYNIDATVFSYLGNVNDGIPVNPDEL